MIIKVEVQVSTRYVGSTVEDEFELKVDNNATDDEIERIVEDEARQWMYEQIDWGYTFEKIENI